MAEGAAAPTTEPVDLLCRIGSLSTRDKRIMDERQYNMSGLKANYFQHILDLSSSSSPSPSPSPSPSSSSSETCVYRRRGRPTTAGCSCPRQPRAEECTCPGVEYHQQYPRFNTAGRAGPVGPPPSPPDDADALAHEALGILNPAEKNELILQMHAKLRQLSGLIEEVRTVSERTVAGLERAHRDALREQMLSEQRLREELLRWRHHHPEVAELHEENARLRDDNDQSRRQYLAVLGKLARRQRLLKTAL